MVLECIEVNKMFYKKEILELELYKELPEFKDEDKILDESNNIFGSQNLSVNNRVCKCIKQMEEGNIVVCTSRYNTTYSCINQQIEQDKYYLLYKDTVIGEYTQEVHTLLNKISKIEYDPHREMEKIKIESLNLKYISKQWEDYKSKSKELFEKDTKRSYDWIENSTHGDYNNNVYNNKDYNFKITIDNKWNKYVNMYDIFYRPSDVIKMLLDHNHEGVVKIEGARNFDVVIENRNCTIDGVKVLKNNLSILVALYYSNQSVSKASLKTYSRLNQMQKKLIDSKEIRIENKEIPIGFTFDHPKKLKILFLGLEKEFEWSFIKDFLFWGRSLRWRYDIEFFYKLTSLMGMNKSEALKKLQIQMFTQNI